MQTPHRYWGGWLLLVGTVCQAQQASPSAFVDCPDCPRMIPIAGGTFTMGSPPTERERRKFEGPQPGVVVQSFAISDAEITRAQYAAFVADTKRDTTGCFTYGFSSFRDETAVDKNASWRNPGFEQTSEHPAVCVSWQDARDYAAWLARKTGRPYRLPSEAEWEYAARAGTNTTFFWGNAEELGCLHANGGDPTLVRALPQLHEEITFALHEGDAGARYLECSDSHAFTAPARSYRPNAFGLYDMIGNAWEYVEDCWYESLPTTGLAHTDGACEFHRGRGGSWDDFPEELRSARRTRIKPDARRNDTGFRIAITPPRERAAGS